MCVNPPCRGYVVNLFLLSLSGLESTAVLNSSVSVSSVSVDVESILEQLQISPHRVSGLCFLPIIRTGMG